MKQSHTNETDANAIHHLVGGGIASLAAAAFLIRDAGVPGEHIRIYEQLSRPGGSLDGSGNAVDGYLVRGGRMFEEHFACTFDLLRTINTLDDPQLSLDEDIRRFNEEVPGSSNCRLVREGNCMDLVRLGLSQRDILDLNRLMVKPERSLSGLTIGHCFNRSFFESGFWMMWSTLFSFQPWHAAVEMRRYLHRFIHLFPGLARIEGILRTRYNQHDSIVDPLVSWLKANGVAFIMDCRVEDVLFDDSRVVRQASELLVAQQGRNERVKLGADDRVYVTLGSMTESSTTGDNDTPAHLNADAGGAWSLWRRLAARHPDFGNPEVFCADPARTSWTSFTVTLANDDFFTHMENFTRNASGTGGLVTFRDSSWLLLLVPE